MKNPNFTAIVLAAGLGTRMKSSRPKVLHRAAGRTLLGHVVYGLKQAGVSEIRAVVGFGADQVREAFAGEKNLGFYDQAKQLGTADAVKSAKVSELKGTVMICNGDHPLITGDDYRQALENFAAKGLDILVLSAVVKNPTAFGRVVRDHQGRFEFIVEEKDATPDQKRIREVNTGLYVVKAEILKELLPKISNENAKGEFYLTDIVSLGLEAGLRVEAVVARSPRVCRGVNNQWELAQAAKMLYLRKCKTLMEAGVMILDPSHTYIDDTVEIGAESFVGPGCEILGRTVIGSRVKVGGHCLIKDSRIGDDTKVKWGSVIEESVVGKACVIGPYGRLRPESELAEEVHIGNFVELKKTKMGKGAKANHLTYLGDAEIGEGTNIGCGTITCNYAVDRKKYKTKIGKNVFVGSDSQFVAPIEIGDGAVIGSGSTITKDVPAKALAVARSKQFIKTDYNKG